MYWPVGNFDSKLEPTRVIDLEHDLAATAEPVPVPVPVIIPDCDTLIPLAEVHTRLGQNFERFGENESSPDGLLARIGPAAKAAIDTAEQQQFCQWGVRMSDGGIADIALANVQ